MRSKKTLALQATLQHVPVPVFSIQPSIITVIGGLTAMKIVPRDQGSHLIVVYFSSFSTLKLVVHAIFYFEKFSETIESSNRDREFKNSLLPRLIAVGQGLPLWARFLEQWLSKRKRPRPLVRVSARSLGHVRSC